jgi:hypothetical protein
MLLFVGSIVKQLGVSRHAVPAVGRLHCSAIHRDTATTETKWSALVQFCYDDAGHLFSAARIRR